MAMVFNALLLWCRVLRKSAWQFPMSKTKWPLMALWNIFDAIPCLVCPRMMSWLSFGGWTTTGQRGNWQTELASSPSHLLRFVSRYMPVNYLKRTALSKCWYICVNYFKRIALLKCWYICVNYFKRELPCQNVITKQEILHFRMEHVIYS